MFGSSFVANRFGLFDQSYPGALFFVRPTAFSGLYSPGPGVRETYSSLLTPIVELGKSSPNLFALTIEPWPLFVSDLGSFLPGLLCHSYPELLAFVCPSAVSGLYSPGPGVLGIWVSLLTPIVFFGSISPNFLLLMILPGPLLTSIFGSGRLGLLDQSNSGYLFLV